MPCSRCFPSRCSAAPQLRNAAENKAALSAVASWMLAESTVTSVRARPERPIVILYASFDPTATRADETALLSEYLLHLA